MKLAERSCKPCKEGSPAFMEHEEEHYIKQLSGWKCEDHRLIKAFEFRDFMEAMDFVSDVAVICEEQQHHPDIEIHFNTVTLTFWTHAINGLSENDFIIAAKIDRI